MTQNSRIPLVNISKSSNHNLMCFELNYLFLAEPKNNSFFLNLVQDTQFIKLIITHQINLNYPSNQSEILKFHFRDQTAIFQSSGTKL